MERFGPKCVCHDEDYVMAVLCHITTITNYTEGVLCRQWKTEDRAQKQVEQSQVELLPAMGKCHKPNTDCELKIARITTASALKQCYSNL